MDHVPHISKILFSYLFYLRQSLIQKYICLLGRLSIGVTVAQNGKECQYSLLQMTEAIDKLERKEEYLLEIM